MSDIVERWPHTKIYLEPRDCADPSTGPLWCQDDIGSEDENGHPIAWEPYIKEKEAADLITALRDENEKLTKRVEWFTHAIHTCHDECDRPLCKTTRERDALRALNAELVDVVKAFTEQMETAMDGMSHPTLGRFIKGMSDVEIKADGKLKLSHARSLITRAEGR